MRIVLSVLLSVFSCFLNAKSVELPGAATATHQAESINGQWLLELNSKDTGLIRVPVEFVSTRQGVVEAHSRAGVLRKMFGWRRALLARLFGGESFQHGALLHLMRGKISIKGQQKFLHGEFLFAGMRAHQFAGEWNGNQLIGQVLRDSGHAFAQVHAVRVDDFAAIRDYSTLAANIEQNLQDKLYDPRQLDSKVWRRFFEDLQQRMSSASDDAEALLHFNQAAKSLNLSHFALLGEAAATLPSLSEPDSKPAVEVHFPSAQLAVLTIRNFAGSPELIQSAFARIAELKAKSLIVDLRGNPGGNLSSMSVAAHLLDANTAAGYFIGSRWWLQHAELPTAEQLARMPELDSPDQARFFQLLNQFGALRGNILPAKPHFSGQVSVLINSATASAAEPLADILQRSGRATLIGETTAGRMLSSEHIDLANGLQLLLPSADYFNAAGGRIEGVGVQPDIVVPSKQALQRAQELLGALGTL